MLKYLLSPLYRNSEIHNTLLAKDKKRVLRTKNQRKYHILPLSISFTNPLPETSVVIVPMTLCRCHLLHKHLELSSACDHLP